MLALCDIDHDAILTYPLILVGSKYKTYYLAVSGPNLKTIHIKKALLQIGDFESIVYEHGAHKAMSRYEYYMSCSFAPILSSHILLINFRSGLTYVCPRLATHLEVKEVQRCFACAS